MLVFMAADLHNTILSRRAFLAFTAMAAGGWNGSISLAQNAATSVAGKRPLMKPVHDAVVCPWTPSHPRHDHQLIFPVDPQRLLLVWSEYYSTSVNPVTIKGHAGADDGRTWTNFRDVDNRQNRDAAYPSVTFVGDEALVAYYSRDTAWKRDSEITLRIYKVDQFYS
jgi:hypothetical protein